MAKKFYWGIWGFLVILGFVFVSSDCLADSSYVLPYPGVMPGHKLYQVEQVVDKLYSLWVFGNLANHKYELKMADKKLVEAKTLFDYDQYLLAVQALKKSDDHFKKAIVYLNKAEKEGKNIIEKKKQFGAAAQKHREELAKLQSRLPEKFIWQPENDTPTNLDLKIIIEEASRLREF